MAQGATAMKILETRVYRGPNLYGYRPMIRIHVDLEELEAYPSNKIPDFTDRLLALIPTLHEHGCADRLPEGFVIRLREGTWMGHVMEHVAIELQCLAGTPVSQGKARGAGVEGQYHVIYEYKEEQVGLEAGRLALDVILSLLPPEIPGGRPDADFDFHRRLEDLI